MEINECVGSDNVVTNQFFLNDWAVLYKEVIRWHLNAEAWVPTHANPCWGYGGKKCHFLLVLRLFHVSIMPSLFRNNPLI